MKIIIEGDGDDREKPYKVQFDNDSLENLNFVDLYIPDLDVDLTFCIDDLKIVIEAFDKYKKKYND